MSTVLLDNGVYAQPHQLWERNMERVTATEDAGTPMARTVVYAHPPPSESDLQWQLISHMASQHHTSEYSRLKFGYRGSSIRYIPLCIHTPDIYDELRVRQMSYNAQVWWICDDKRADQLQPDSAPPAVTLANELSSAMGESLPQVAVAPSASTSSDSHVLKTSATHPINVSSIIPPDVVPLISSHVLLASCRPGCTCHNDSSLAACRASATVCEISPSFTLDRLIGTDYGILSSSSRPDLSPPPSPLHPRSPSSPSHLQTRSHVSQALQVAMNSGLANPSPLPSISALSLNVQSPTPEGVHVKDNTSSTTIHSNHSSVSLSLSLISTPTIIQKQSSSVGVPSTSLSTPEHSFQDPLFSNQPASNVIIPSEPLMPISTFTLGNLYLSSCPGKKVRLQGPVKGRSGVCRDLATDLRRMKDMGVGCIICCLDDVELEFLGSPWPEYQRLAQEIGIDVMRLPTPEGLAPSQEPAVLNQHLTTLIQRYTLHGIPVLVHCRGGVGRAGVVACCWMIRLGLFGLLNDPVVDGAADTRSNGWTSQTHILSPGLKSMDIVRKAIDAIRRRRSLKAIETYEQVKFLVDYVNFLRTPTTV